MGDRCVEIEILQSKEKPVSSPRRKLLVVGSSSGQLRRGGIRDHPGLPPTKLS